jgi:hypothetical protein
MLNKRKEKIWAGMTVEEKANYQADIDARERDGNRRLEFRFKY